MKRKIKELNMFDIEKIHDMYNKGIVIQEICDTANISKSTFWRLKQQYEWPSIRHVYKKHKTEESYQLFLNKFYHSSILNPNIRTDDYRQNRIRYSLDENYFDVIDNQNKAYLLGLIMADGSIRNNTLDISLQESDKYILEKYLLELKCDAHLRFLDYNHKNPNWSNQYTVSITSPHLIHSLLYYNVIPNKSNLLEFPTTLDFDLYRHLIRGYLDGDGTILKPQRRNQCSDKGVKIVSTLSFCEDLKLIIENFLEINCSIIFCHDHSKPTRELSIRGGRQCKILLDWLYNDAELYLNRKYDIYQTYYK